MRQEVRPGGGADRVALVAAEVSSTTTSLGLVFTHVCGKTKEVWFTLVRHTMAKRMRAKLVEIKEALNRMRHVPVPEQGRWPGQVMRGYLAYHAVPTNARKVTSFHVRRVALATRALAPKLVN